MSAPASPPTPPPPSDSTPPAPVGEAPILAASELGALLAAPPPRPPWAPVAVALSLVMLFAAALLVNGLVGGTSLPAGPPSLATFWLGALMTQGPIFFGLAIGLLLGAAPGERWPTLGLHSWDSSLYLRTVAWLALILPTVAVVNLLTQVLCQQLGWDPRPQDLLDWWATGSPLLRLSIVLAAVVLAPLAEECFFRGAVHQVLRRYLSDDAAMGISALCFAAMHLQLNIVPGLWVMGVLLQRAYRASGTLWLPILIHAGFNAVMLGLALCFPGLG